ncbi:MAG: ribbon-helix-helix domain-containing protein [Promethearchaeia archaeon]
MKIITINLSERYLNAIKVLTDLGVYPSRSEAIRVALDDFLKDEIRMYDELNEDNFKLIVRSSLKHRD